MCDLLSLFRTVRFTSHRLVCSGIQSSRNNAILANCTEFLCNVAVQGVDTQNASSILKTVSVMVSLLRLHKTATLHFQVTQEAFCNCPSS